MTPIVTDTPKKIETRRITIDPITRLEGHGKVEIFLNSEGNVENVYFQVPELRGFERFCIGRPVEELARITTRLCGVCPGAHHMAASKALDRVFKADPPEAAKKLRELFYCAHYVHSHIAHFYALAAPDFIVGPAAPAAKRNILGVVEAVGVKIGGEVIKHRSYAQKIQEIIGGKATHPVCGLPGGMSRPISEEERKEIEAMAKSCVEFSKFSLQILNDVVLKNQDYLNLITNPNLYYMETYYMGLVDRNDKVNFYDGSIRVVDQNGKEFAKFQPEDYLEYIAEHVEPWSYLKFPYLKQFGWKGLIAGPDSGVYRVAPLARLNVSSGFATPIAQQEYEKLVETVRSLGATMPVHFTMVNHWARVIEMVYAAERLLELAQDSEITSKELRAELGEPGEGVGVVEAPRGTLIHHYWADSDGITRKLNLIVATGNNNAAICMSLKNAAQALIRNWNVSEGLLNMVEMAFRAYDPCFACGTHMPQGQMPLEVRIYSKDGKLYRSIKRGV